MKASELKIRLQKAINNGIIKCKNIESLKCPATGYELVHGRCIRESRRDLRDVCPIGDKHRCTHRVDVVYDDKSDPNILIVHYRIKSGVKEGFIDDDNRHLRTVLKKIS